MPSMSDEPLLVEIKSPEKMIWEGRALSVSSINSQGPFDILGMHANFITIVEGKPILIRTQGKVQEYSFPRSVIYTHKNSVKIYCNI